MIRSEGVQSPDPPPLDLHSLHSWPEYLPVYCYWCDVAQQDDRCPPQALHRVAAFQLQRDAVALLACGGNFFFRHGGQCCIGLRTVNCSAGGVALMALVLVVWQRVYSGTLSWTKSYSTTPSVIERVMTATKHTASASMPTKERSMAMPPYGLTIDFSTIFSAAAVIWLTKSWW